MDILQQVRNQFSQIAALPGDKIDLVRTGLLIARIAYPKLNEFYYLARLAQMGARLKSRISDASDPYICIEEINQILFEEEGFRGNTVNYYDPENSFLNRVIDRKLGIPISLSVIYMGVGQRAGLDIRGVGLPGHFITALLHQSRSIFIDPFNRGNILSQEECRQLGKERVFEMHLLDPISPKAILERMLRNLKAIYLHTNDDLRAFQMIHWILEINPDAQSELRERGLLYSHMGNIERAIKDLKRYLELSPMAEDEPQIREQIKRLRGQTTRIH